MLWVGANRTCHSMRYVKKRGIQDDFNGFCLEGQGKSQHYLLKWGSLLRFEARKEK